MNAFYETQPDGSIKAEVICFICGIHDIVTATEENCKADEIEGWTPLTITSVFNNSVVTAFFCKDCKRSADPLYVLTHEGYVFV